VKSFGDVSALLTDRAVAEVEVHRPPSNFFDGPLLASVVEAIDWAHSEGGRAVVLCSEGRNFCAGFDFGSTDGPAPEQLRTLYGHAAALVDGPLPVVVAVQGAAVGGGLGLALAGDFRIASAGSRFSANFARLGLHQGFGVSVTLPRAIGEQRALEMLLTGRRVEGAEALRIGLCDGLHEDARAGAHELAQEIAASAPLAVQAIRRTQRDGLAGAFERAVQREQREQLTLMRTADFREGIQASRDRRPPEFNGR
jgi:2-(1,2-epoxy-1,2-dihydrophenyl)acetyl-CoA isomerase